jgi:hypothetical protein
MEALYALLVFSVLAAFLLRLAAWLYQKSKISQAREAAERQAVAAAGTLFTNYRSFCETFFFDTIFLASCSQNSKCLA